MGSNLDTSEESGVKRQKLLSGTFEDTSMDLPPLISDSSVGNGPLNFREAVVSTNVGHPPDCPLVSPLELTEEDLLVAEEDGCPTICFSQHVKEQLNQRWENALIVKIMGAAFSYSFVLHKLQQKWGHLKGHWHLMDISNDSFIVRFDNQDDLHYVLYNGPWVIAGYYLALQMWKPDYNAQVDKISHLTVWIRIAGLKAEWFDIGILKSLGNLIGTTHKVDSRTTQLARGQYARVCIELDIRKPLVHKIKIKDKWYLIQYEGLHLVCFGCGTYGHDKLHCKADGVNQAVDIMETNDDNNLEDAGLKATHPTAANEEELIALKTHDEKFGAFNKWNLVSSRSQKRMQSSAVRQAPYNQSRKKEVVNSNSGAYTQGFRNRAIADKGKGRAENQDVAKPRYVNSERLYMGNNFHYLKKITPYGIKPRVAQVQQNPVQKPVQVPHKKYTPASQTITKTGVQVHDFIQLGEGNEDKGKSQELEELQRLQRQKLMQVAGVSRQDATTNSDMDGVIITHPLPTTV